MATAKQYPDYDPSLDNELLPPIHEVSPEEGWEILDRQARERLGMSGEEFIRKWEANEFEDPDQSDIIFLSFMIPFTREL